jgi:hypothetical protein
MQMKKYTLLAISLLSQSTVIFAQQAIVTSYTEKTYMIPMRGWHQAVYGGVFPNR